MACMHLCSVEGVYEAFHTELRRFVLGKVSDPATADDILQDVYLRIHSHIAGLRDCSRLQSWVYQIARNAIVDHYRGRRPAVELPETLPEPGAAPGDLLGSVQPRTWGLWEAEVEVALPPHPRRAGNGLGRQLPAAGHRSPLELQGIHEQRLAPGRRRR